MRFSVLKWWGKPGKIIPQLLADEMVVWGGLELLPQFLCLSSFWIVFKTILKGRNNMKKMIFKAFFCVLLRFCSANGKAYIDNCFADLYVLSD